jgi:mycothiol synthase
VPDIEVKRQLDEEDLAAVTELLTAASEADAHPALGEHAWLDLVQGGREGFAGLVAWEPGHPHPVGYAQLSLGPHDATSGSYSWGLEVVVDPHHRTPGNTVAIDLVRGAMKLIADEGGGHLHLWVSQPAPYHDRMAAAVGLHPGRALYQMRRPLPADEHASIKTRPFRPGSDEQAWLEVNNRAFHWHPEQGGWTEETLKARETQPWFDPDGFLLYETDGPGPGPGPGSGSGEHGHRLAGFCWTKVHQAPSPSPARSSPARSSPARSSSARSSSARSSSDGRALGEIYVVAVDPDFAGRGLGRQLTLAGLDHLASKGVTEAMLYVDATNMPAVKLYVELGFTVNHIDRAYTGDIKPGPRPEPA